MPRRSRTRSGPRRSLPSASFPSSYGTPCAKRCRMPAVQENLIKIKLTNRGADEETPWAEDLGAAESHGLHAPPGSRVVRLANVPYLHAKPTHGDVVLVSPNATGELAWDRDGLPWTQIPSRIHHDGGRWAMIL